MRVGDPGFGESVTVVRTSSAGQDPWGDPVDEEETRTAVDGCAVAPLKLAEDTDADGITYIDGWTLYLPLGTAIAADDRVIVRGRVFHVDGTPGVWVNPYSTGHPSGVEVIVKAG